MSTETPNFSLDCLFREFDLKHQEDLKSFCFFGIDFSEHSQLFNILGKSMTFVRSQYQLKGQDVLRKVNEGLYLRHVLRTAVLASEIFNNLPDDLKTSIDYDVLIFASLFHDVLEVRRNNGQTEEETSEGLVNFLRNQSLSEDRINLIIDLVKILTPLKEEKEKTSYSEGKRRDFLRIWSEEDEIKRGYLRIIKSADVLANIEETSIDLELGKENGQMKTPLALRYQVFAERFSYIEKDLELKIEFFNYFTRRLSKIFNFCYGLHNLTYCILEEFGGYNFEELELKYVIEEDKIIIGSSSFFVHKNMTQSQENYGGVIKVYKTGKEKNLFVIDFIKPSLSIKPDDNGKEFFALLRSITKDEIVILSPNLNSLFAGLCSQGEYFD
ncbi:MAG: HD domain-containing protein [Patescibacteria group bacterium]|nr:HD domain-containing protein [Patescibacteria group bacterium]